MIIGIGFSKRLADRFGKRDVFGAALFVSTLCLLAFWFYSPTSIGLVVVSYILHGFFYGITIPLLWAMIADVADYSEWKNHRRATAIIFSAILCGLKIGLSVGGALVAGILALLRLRRRRWPRSRRKRCMASSWRSACTARSRSWSAWRCCSCTRSTRRWSRASNRSSARAAPRPAPESSTQTSHAEQIDMADDIRPRSQLKALAAKAISQPLVTHIYTADPSAHVFDGKLYIYPSHDIEAGIAVQRRRRPLRHAGLPRAAHGFAGGRSGRLRRRVACQGRALGRAADVGAGCRLPRRPLLLLLPGQARRRHLPDRRGRRRRSGRSVRGRAAADRQAAIPSTRPRSPTTTASATCISAASGAGSCRSTATMSTTPSHEEPADGATGAGPAHGAPGRGHEAVRRSAARSADRRRGRPAAARRRP